MARGARRAVGCEGHLLVRDAVGRDREALGAAAGAERGTRVGIEAWGPCIVTNRLSSQAPVRCGCTVSLDASVGQASLASVCISRRSLRQGRGGLRER